MKQIVILTLLSCYAVPGKAGLLDTTNNLKKVGNVKLSLDLDPLALVNVGDITTEMSTTEGTTEAMTTTTGFSRSKPQTIRTESSLCGVKYILHTELIRNGSPTKHGDWPWHVALYRFNTQGSQQQYICGGSLISRYRVITAAHCVVENQGTILPDRLIVIAGKHNLNAGEEESQQKSVFNIIVHPSFSRSTMVNDIAILKLSSSVRYTDYVQPICLWTSSVADTDKRKLFDESGTVIGWGYTEDDRLSSELMMTRLPVVSDLDCIRSNPLFYSRFVTENSYCAGLRNGTGVCNGDSGGGMYFSGNRENQEVWYLRGLVSLTASRKDRNICDPNEYIIFTDVAQFNEFIEENL